MPSSMKDEPSLSNDSKILELKTCFSNLLIFHQLTILSLNLYTYRSILYYTRYVKLEEDRCGPSCSIHDHSNDVGTDECECECSNKHKHDDCSCSDMDPVNAAKSLLESAFFVALKEVHVEKLKKLIEKEWGSTIDKGVELTFKIMEKQWQSAISKTAANKEFYSELEKILAASKATTNKENH